LTSKIVECVQSNEPIGYFLFERFKGQQLADCPACRATFDLVFSGLLFCHSIRVSVYRLNGLGTAFGQRAANGKFSCQIGRMLRFQFLG
jgi:hypothetical protein